MGGQRKTAVSINPAVSIRFAPSAFFINATETFGYDAFFFVLFVLHRSLGFVHHFIATDDVAFTPAQERAER